MSSHKKQIADLFLGVQIVGALLLCGSQFFRLLKTTEGQSLGMFIVMEAYIMLHLMLAVGAHQAQPSRVTRQTIFTFAMWVVLIASNIGAILWNGGYRWDGKDNLIMALALVGTVVVFGGAKLKGVGIQAPAAKALLAMLFKALPQFIMAWKVAQEGGAGVPLLAIIAGHLTILTRIGQIWLAIREAGWDRNRVWLGISETANEISWVAVSLTWTIWLITK